MCTLPTPGDTDISYVGYAFARAPAVGLPDKRQGDSVLWRQGACQAVASTRSNIVVAVEGAIPDWFGVVEGSATTISQAASPRADEVVPGSISKGSRLRREPHFAGIYTL